MGPVKCEDLRGSPQLVRKHALGLKLVIILGPWQKDLTKPKPGREKGEENPGEGGPTSGQATPEACPTEAPVKACENSPCSLTFHSPNENPSLTAH